MANALGRLLRLGRDRSTRARPPDGDTAVDGSELAVDGDESALDDDRLGPPVLLPAAIFTQVLVDATESEPDWARPRSAPAPEPAASPAPEPAASPAPEPAASPAPEPAVPPDPMAAAGSPVTDEAPTAPPKPTKRTRQPKTSSSRPKASGSPAVSRTRSKRVPKTDQTATDG
jgi:hypothetical protein